VRSVLVARFALGRIEGTIYSSEAFVNDLVEPFFR
jgi:hypothetical protein